MNLAGLSLMTRNVISIFLVAGLCSCLQTVTASTEVTRQPSRPNFIVILTDDQGYADLSSQGQTNDVRTPHIDSLAASGVRMTSAYVTAPQCSPSRAGLMTGRYQQRYGVDEISMCPLPLEEVTLAERLKDVGYTTGMVGKWHLNPNAVSLKWARENLSASRIGENGWVNVPFEKMLEYYPHRQGFDEYFVGEVQIYYSNFNLDTGEVASEGQQVRETGYRIDVQTKSAVSFIDRNAKAPFFLYVGYFGPHVPLQATEKYLKRFPGEMKERRRYGLAMLSAIDDGVGAILETLRRHGIEDKTLIVFTSDNGAPLKTGMPDDPVGDGGPTWDGSLNTPMNGEKGMLSEGGIRVPFVMQWKQKLPRGLVYDHPVSTLDITPTIVAAAGLSHDPALDGINLIPAFSQESPPPPERSLYWRFWNQSAVRSGPWKYIRVGAHREFLFDLSNDESEQLNLAGDHPEIVNRLHAELDTWSGQLLPPGLPNEVNDIERRWYDFYFE